MAAFVKISTQSETAKPKRRKKPRQNVAVEERLSSDSANFQEILASAAWETTSEIGNKKKRRSKLKSESGILEKLQRGEGLEKDKDEALLANMYASEELSPKVKKKTQSYQMGVDNEAFIEHQHEESIPKPKPRKKKREEEARRRMVAENHEDIPMEEFAGMQRKKKKKKKKPASKESLMDEGLVTAVKVHRTDKIKADVSILRPLVRVTIVDVDDGKLFCKESLNATEKENQNSDEISAQMTKQFDFKQHRSILPIWEEQMVFDLSYNILVQDHPSAVIFFELLDLANMSTKKANWNKIAWAFIKIRAINGKLNVEKRLRLQLFYPNSRSAKDSPLQVYQWWCRSQRIKYPSTLYVTVSKALPVEVAAAAEKADEAIRENSDLVNAVETLRSNQTDLPWSRLQGQFCKVPNLLCLTLYAGQQGCMTTNFSHSGKLLACAGRERSSFPVFIYEIPSGNRRSRLFGHNGLVYSLRWSMDGKDDGQLLSASADGTARVWDAKSWELKKVLTHPSFVYAAEFVAGCQTLAVTASFDKIIRVWSLTDNNLSAQVVQEISGHAGHVNTLCFDNEGTLYSGDSVGCIRVCQSFGKSFQFIEEISCPEIEATSICDIHIHPLSPRILIQTKDNKLRLFDLRRKAVIVRYVGAVIMQNHLSCSFSSCGTFVFSTSEDSAAYCWRTETGDQVAAYLSLGFTAAVCGIHFHPHDNFIAMCSLGEANHVLVYKYSVSDARLTFMNAVSTVINQNGRPGAPEVTNSLSVPVDKLEETREELMATSRTIKGQDVKNLQQVMNKLSAVNAFLSHPQPALSASKSNGLQSFIMNAPSSLYSPHANKSPLNTLRQNYHESQSEYLHKGDHEWRPSFAAVGQPGIHQANIDRSMSPAMNMSLTGQGLPTFKFTPATHDTQPDSLNEVLALYDYSAQRSDELSFATGDTIIVLHRDNKNWWMGELVNGQQGFFPSNFVECKEPAKEGNETEGISNTKVRAYTSTSGHLRFISDESEEEIKVSAAPEPTRRKRHRMESFA